MNWKLSPSDLVFLWEECKRCFYLKEVHGFNRPRPIMPKIFTLIDVEMKNFYANKRTEEISDKLPPGVIEHSEKWVESVPIQIEDCSSTCFVRGKFDTIARFDEGSYGVIDFKTAQRKSEHIPLYSRQLHSYALALENPAPRAFSVSPITKIGLLVFEPAKYTQGKTGVVGFAGNMSWIEIQRDDGLFKQFLKEVINLLEQPTPPAPNPECEWCRFRVPRKGIDYK